MKSISLFFYRLYMILFAVPVMAVCLVLLGAYIFISALTVGEKFTGKAVYIYNVIISSLIGLKIQTEGNDNIIPGQSYIVVANHRSNLDPNILYLALKFDFRWIMKIELLKIPVFGFICRRMGNIAIDRKNPALAIKSIQEVKKRISNGKCIAFFSEGTRHNGTGLLPFKKGAFHFAIDAAIPILPVTINYSDLRLPKHSVDVRAGEVKVIIHKPVETSGRQLSDMPAIEKITREAILSALDTSYVNEQPKS
ncbi:MAG: 1-acyl-sn-glycerol-3-phosphate acyltransferase [Spirochaetes bacterium]|nr:1-acyl-sn-glycerol-3-phosphate acyltransferase [Spirochaetota bacterium]